MKILKKIIDFITMILAWLCFWTISILALIIVICLVLLLIGSLFVGAYEIVKMIFW